MKPEKNIGIKKLNDWHNESPICKVDIVKPSDVVFIDVNSINNSDYDTIYMILNVAVNKYTLFPTENPIVDVPKRLNEENVNNDVILTREPEKLNKPFANNVIDLNALTQEKLEKQKQEKARKDSLKAALDAANKSNGAQTTKSGSKKLNQSSADNSDRNYPTRKRGN